MANDQVSLLSVRLGKFAGRVVARVRTSGGVDLFEAMVTYEVAWPFARAHTRARDEVARPFARARAREGRGVRARRF